MANETVSKATSLTELLAGGNLELLADPEYQSTPLSAEQQEEVAKIFPHWGVEAGFGDGESFKRFSRIIDRDADGKLNERHARSIYKRFADGEPWDDVLPTVFGTGNFTGYNFSDHHIFYLDVEPGPITVRDALLLDEAERRLAEAYVMDFEGFIKDVLPHPVEQ